MCYTDATIHPVAIRRICGLGPALTTLEIGNVKGEGGIVLPTASAPLPPRPRRRPRRRKPDDYPTSERMPPPRVSVGADR
jgi:hypothetical protein